MHYCTNNSDAFLNIILIDHKIGQPKYTSDTSLDYLFIFFAAVQELLEKTKILILNSQKVVV